MKKTVLAAISRIVRQIKNIQSPSFFIFIRTARANATTSVYKIAFPVFELEIRFVIINIRYLRLNPYGMGKKVFVFYKENNCQNKKYDGTDGKKMHKECVFFHDGNQSFSLNLCKVISGAALAKL